LHTSNTSVGNLGWYIDDLSIVSASPAFTGDFETGWGDWGAGNGLWQVGTPTAGPTNCFSGTQCAGTVLDGNYPGLTDSRMVSASTQLPTVSGAEEVHLRFQQWFSYSGSVSGQVQVSVWNSATSTWGAWVSEGAAITNVSAVWSLKDNTSVGNLGWYIDEIGISVF